jgi:predicted metalloprotease with PDZ domain
LTLSLPVKWAGIDGLERSIASIGAESEEGDPLNVVRSESSVTIAHNNESQVNIYYRVVPRHRHLSREARFQVVGTQDYFFSYGRNMLLWPTHLDARLEPVQLYLSRGTAGGRWVSTTAEMGSEIIQSEHSWNQLADTAYLYGRFRELSVVTEGHHISVAIEPQLLFSESEVLDLLVQLVRTVNTSMGPPEESHTVALMLLREDDPNVATGSGRPGGFVVEVGQNIEVGGAAFAQLIFHEHLHRYFGGLLQFEREEEIGTLWFKEGVVDYLAARLSLRAGAINVGDYLDKVTSVVTSYLTNSEVGVPYSDWSEEEYWQNPLRQRLPYQQGFLLGLWLDHRGQGRVGLEEMISELMVDTACGDHLTNLDIRLFFEAQLDLDLTDFFRDYVSGNEEIPVHHWLDEAGLTVEYITERRPYYGVEVFDEGGFWRVVGIDPLGPASGLSLSPGDMLVEAPQIPTHGLDSEAIFVVDRGIHLQEIVVPPFPGEWRQWRVEATSRGLEKLLSW